MQISFRETHLKLQPDQPLSLRHAHGITVVCVSGALWITEAGDTADRVLTIGDRCTFASDQHVVIEALGHAELRLEVPRPRALSHLQALGGGIIHWLARLRQTASA